MQKFKGFKIDFLREPLEQLRLIQNQSSLIVEDLSELFEKINNQSQVDISQLNKNLDANYKRITRLGEPIENLDAVRKEDLDIVSQDLNRHLSDFNNPHQTGLSNLSDYNANFNNISNVFINGYYLYLSNFGNFFQIGNVYANGLNAMYNLNGELLFNSSPNANTIYYPYRASSCYLLNANYDSSITSSSSSIYYLKIQPYLLNGVSYLPNVVSESSITNWHFRKVNNIIYVNDSLINSQPNYYARLNVGETMICELSWNNSSASRYIPLKINSGEKYYIKTIYSSSTLPQNSLRILAYDSSSLSTVEQYLILDVNQGLIRSWRRTSNPYFAWVGYIAGEGGGVPAVMDGDLSIGAEYSENGNTYFYFESSFISRAKSWQFYNINSWGFLLKRNFLVVSPSSSSTNLKLIINITRTY
ncbi:MAG: hypothetical protein SNJ64_04725 [Endomicrobiia bacterium]